MFVWQARVLLDEMQRLLPDVARALAIADAWDTPGRDAVLERIWPRIAEVTIDHGILERSDRVAVVPGRFGWTDLGDWHGFGKVVGGDERANLAINAELLALDASGSRGTGTSDWWHCWESRTWSSSTRTMRCWSALARQDVRHLVEGLKRRGSTGLI